MKPYLRWAVLGTILFFLASTLKRHWEEVAAIQIGPTGYGYLAAGLGVTLLAHLWSGWIWSWILRELNQPAGAGWSISVYLTTNIAKYLPGNIWQFYGRIIAAKNAGFSVGAATVSVVLEPLLMATAALAIALSGIQQSHWLWQGLILVGVLVGIHPRILNPLLQMASRMKLKKSRPKFVSQDQTDESSAAQESNRQDALDQNLQDLKIRRYPLLPLLGEVGFVLLRGAGFLLTLLALSPIAPAQIPVTLSAFSFAWMLGLIVPGAPGGIGIFEATAIALLQSQFPIGAILGSVALYRLLSILAEAIGAAGAWSLEKCRL
jgi:glycosyltransferase 2 family protein